MSGGYFNYGQHGISDIIERLAHKIRRHKYPITTYEKEYPYSKETILELEKGLEYLQKAEIYTQRIDWLLSGDDGEETFHERLKEELSKI